MVTTGPGGQNKVLYFVLATQSRAVKIGLTTERGLAGRLKVLQSCSGEVQVLLGFCDAASHLSEAWMHAIFSQSRIHGEWFKDSCTIRSWIRKKIPRQHRRVPYLSVTAEKTGKTRRKIFRLTKRSRPRLPKYVNYGKVSQTWQPQ